MAYFSMFMIQHRVLCIMMYFVSYRKGMQDHDEAGLSSEKPDIIRR